MNTCNTFFLCFTVEFQLSSRHKMKTHLIVKIETDRSILADKLND